MLLILGSKGVISGNGVSVWYENDTIGRTKTAAKSGSDFTYTNTATMTHKIRVCMA